MQIGWLYLQAFGCRAIPLSGFTVAGGAANHEYRRSGLDACFVGLNGIRNLGRLFRHAVGRACRVFVLMIIPSFLSMRILVVMGSLIRVLIFTLVPMLILGFLSMRILFVMGGLVSVPILGFVVVGRLISQAQWRAYLLVGRPLRLVAQMTLRRKRPTRISPPSPQPERHTISV